MRAKYTRLFTAGMSRFEGIDIQVHPRFPLSVAEFECGSLHGIGRHKWHGVPRFHAASRRDERKTAEVKRVG